MQYSSNPDELWAVAKERHRDWMREAALLRSIQQAQPATRHPLTAKLGGLRQGMMRASKQSWTQARTILRLAPVER